jgi:hypothetical protein
MSESEDEVAQTAQKKVKAVEAVAAASSSGTACGSTAGTSRGRAGKKRGRSGHRPPSPRGSDDDENGEDDNGSSSSGVPSTDSEKESDDDEGDAGDTFASGVATSDDDDEEEEEEEEEQEEEKKKEQEQEAPTQQQKKQKVAEAVDTEHERVAAASAELAAKDAALRSNMHEIAAQSYEHVSAWQRGERGPPMTETSAFDVHQDLVAIQNAKSPMAIVAAMSNLVKNLVNAHHEHFKGATCEIPKAHEQRLRAACNQAVQFSDATMVRLDKAIQELTEARAMGHEVLKQIATPSAGETASPSFTA